MKTTIIILSLVMVIFGVGCASLSYMVTPARLEPKAIEYAAKANIVEPNVFAGYQNLDKAIRLEKAVTGAHQVNQLAYQQMIEKDQLGYAQLNDLVVQNRTIAMQREEALFGPEGLLTLGLSMAGFGTLTGFVGLMRKRPQDVTPEDVESLLADLKVELSGKDRQLVELIRGVQAFMDAAPSESGDVIIAELKKYLSTAQSADTKIKVAETKATL